eukprot:CAMPEP_0178996536 /NCGR_PEP_ID=MMETSP0795-20121207/8418_1 /TAXON_ID=88552 /ORGANISM="Amoebophrya sp., Strain Ameob2" /LENGTH=680 /DNA_ID=CAMNT_0020688927 /DNA_START=142 /DNA_END=2184 /DNA_ORIENTATION=-
MSPPTIAVKRGDVTEEASTAQGTSSSGEENTTQAQQDSSFHYDATNNSHLHEHSDDEQRGLLLGSDKLLSLSSSGAGTTTTASEVDGTSSTFSSSHHRIVGEHKSRVRLKSVATSPVDTEEEHDGDYADNVAAGGGEHKDKEKVSVLTRPVEWLATLHDLYGFKLLFMLFAAQHLLKGFAGTFVSQPERFIYKSYHVEGPQVQIYMGVSGLPWAMKPIVGLLSDLVPIGGYNKRPYILIASVLGVFSMVCLAFVQVPVIVIVLLFFCIALQRSVCDLLTEAKYAEALKKKPQHGPDLMTFVWGGIEISGLIALLFVGPLVEAIGPRKPYLILLPFAAMILYPTYKNYLDESKRTHAETQEHRKKLVTENREVFGLCVLITGCTLAMTLSGILFTSVKVHALTALVVLIVILVSFSLVLRPEIAKMNAFFLLQGSLSIGISGASFYFFTDGPKEYPAGPHFSPTFFVTVLGITGSCCSLIGLAFYNRYLKDYTYTTLLTGTNILGSCLSLADLLVFTRGNLAWGINDHMFVLGGTVSASLIGNWQWIPGVCMLSQMCPKNMEATLYALLAGCHNLGNSISDYFGAFVLESLGCTPAGRPDEGATFENLWFAALIGTTVPIVTLSLIPWMIPNARQTDTILSENPDSATAGSLYSQWVMGAKKSSENGGRDGYGTVETNDGI